MTKNQKVVIASMCGNALEYFDLMLYAHFMFILTPLFFPHNDPHVSRLMGVSAFVLGFIIRPIGSIFFGHLGDKAGRRLALALSIGLMAIPTFIMGVLPTYASIGITAPIILLICRILQNFCVSGESTGSAIFLVEHADPHNKCFMGSLLNTSLLLGSIMGTVLGYLSTSFLPDWGWRIPFIIGSLFGWIGFYIRYKIGETPAFNSANVKERPSIPLLTAIKNYKYNFVCVIGICAGIMVAFYTTYIYMADVLKYQLHFSPQRIMAHNTIMMATCVIFLPLMGIIADKVGEKKVMQIAAFILAFSAYPLFYLLTSTNAISGVIIAQLILGLCWSGLAGPTCALTTSLFPIIGRYSAISVAWSIGAIIFAGSAPFCCIYLAKWLNNPAAPAIYLAFCAVLCWIGVKYSKPVKIEIIKKQHPKTISKPSVKNKVA